MAVFFYLSYSHRSMQKATLTMVAVIAAFAVDKVTKINLLALAFALFVFVLFFNQLAAA